ncbi:hypothetical protein BaRGS_00005120, partial [Batillaria attramentaria]
WDRLEVRDGDAEDAEVHTFCGTQHVQLISQHDTVHVRFYSDVSNGDVGFRIFYSEILPEGRMAMPACNVTLTNDVGDFISPFHPGRYPPSVTCFYLIQAPPDHKVEVEFDAFDVESSPCTYDRVTVYDGPDTGSPVIGTYCGQELPPYILTTNSTFLAVFVADDSVEMTGFSAAYRFIAPPTTPVTPPTTPQPLFEGDADCYQVMTAEQGNISSPGYPDDYPPNKHCVTVLRSNVTSSFVFEFSDFDVEDGDNCSYDALELIAINDIDVESERSAEERHVILCSHGPKTGVVTLQGSEVKLVFTSDMSINGGGYFGTFFAAPVDTEAGCSTPCENGGSCAREALRQGRFVWRCLCNEGFTGAQCEREQETCDQVICQNNGVCRHGMQGEGVVCDCPPGFSGDRCQDYVSTGDEEGVVFTKMPGNMSVSIDSSLLLECAVNDPEADVMWLYRDRILTESDRRAGVEVHPGGVVYITEVQEQHEGRYTCMAVTATDLLERSMWLTIKEPCSLAVERSPQNMTVREGETALFQCLVPDADVTMWRKDGDMVKQGPRKRMLVNNYLMVSGVVETDAGEYTCAARDTDGCFAKVSAYLSVETVGHGRQCGKPKVNAFEGRSYRISSGREAPDGSAPWPSSSLFLGTRHCQGLGGIQRRLKSYILHPDFEGSNFNNDLALFELDAPVLMSEDIMPICMERAVFVDELLRGGRLGVVTGCGSLFEEGRSPTYLNECLMSEDIMPICMERAVFVDELLRGGRLGVVTGCGSLFEEGRSPTYLNEVKLPYVPRDVCAERALAVNASFTEGMMCAGYSRSMRGDACAGDSGGPYIMEYSGRFVLVGIVSWGVGCDRENQYGYYTHVSRYYDWIIQTTGGISAGNGRPSQLTSFRANRFNNLFEAAAALTYHRDIIQFLGSARPATNLNAAECLCRCQPIHGYLKEMIHHPEMLLTDVPHELASFRIQDKQV